MVRAKREPKASVPEWSQRAYNRATVNMAKHRRHRIAGIGLRLVVDSPAIGEGQRELEINGLRVLVVEDSAFLAELIEDMLTEAGAIVVGSASSVDAALDELRGQSVDLVCLDVMLGPELSFAIADALTVQRIPFVFVTACDPAIVPDRHRRQPLIDKMDLVTQLVATCRAAWTSAASPALS